MLKLSKYSAKSEIKSWSETKRFAHHSAQRTRSKYFSPSSFMCLEESTANLAGAIAGLDAPRPHYRFVSTLQKANEFAQFPHNLSLRCVDLCAAFMTPMISQCMFPTL